MGSTSKDKPPKSYVWFTVRAKCRTGAASAPALALTNDLYC